MAAAGKAVADLELLKRAVVALERKLREAQAASAGLERELAAARGAAANQPVVQASLQQARAAAEQQQQRADRLARDLAAAKAEAAEAAQQRDRARAALEAAEAADDECCRAEAQRRGEAQAAALELARARGQAEVLAAQVQQLEGTNATLRQDNRQHAERLRQAFEREGELLAELAELQAMLRAQGTSSRSRSSQPPPAAARLTSAAGAAAAEVQAAAAWNSAAGCTAINASAPTPRGNLAGSVEAQAEQQLLMTAAQQLTEECTARLAQAEGRARQLEGQLQAVTATLEQVQQEAARQAAAAAAAREEAAQERQAAQALLDNTQRLHEAVAQLMDEGLGGGCSMDGGNSSCFRVAAPGEPAEPAGHTGGRAATGDGRAQRQQQRARSSSLPRAAKQAPCAERGGQEVVRPAGSGEQQRGQRSRQLMPAELLPAATGAAPVRPQQLPARKSAQLARPPPAGRQLPAQAPPAVDPAARQAAVKAALALSAEHRELHSCYRAVAEELRRVAGALVAAPTTKQLALLRQHAALQQEQRDLAEQLEDRVLQLAALKQAGVL